MLYKVVLSFESVDEILKCDHSNESYWEYFPAVLFIMLYKVVLTCGFVDEILKCDHSNESDRAVLSSTSPRTLLLFSKALLSLSLIMILLTVCRLFVRYWINVSIDLVAFLILEFKIFSSEGHTPRIWWAARLLSQTIWVKRVNVSVRNVELP